MNFFIAFFVPAKCLRYDIARKYEILILKIDINDDDKKLTKFHGDEINYSFKEYLSK